ncbi:IclR family transcriptional regulator [Streptomyces sp. TP-A0874]|uniref:IclR family transcriptional regulator n=1 Tax=Streptomyces sp. TP-A0874 TaxID=549819 RepID=UPI0008531BC7|nr:IclR family transcriptional regulator [Streptomyces sp. TP-A0874]
MSNNEKRGESASSVAHALRTLLYLRGQEAVRLTDVSEHLGVARSTAHRLLTTLREHGFVEQEPGGRRYRLGPALLGLARGLAEERALIRIARPHLESLRDAADETSNLLVLDGPDAFFLDGVDGTQPLRVVPRTGDHVPAYSTAGGKAILAELPPEAVRLRYPSGLTRLTPATLPDLDALAADLALTRERGYALNFDESVVEVHGAAVPVRDRHGAAIAAVTVSAPSTRLDHARAAALAPLLRSTADAISAQL